jgi:hypothetical protein
MSGWSAQQRPWIVIAFIGSLLAGCGNSSGDGPNYVSFFWRIFSVVAIALITLAATCMIVLALFLLLAHGVRRLRQSR